MFQMPRKMSWALVEEGLDLRMGWGAEEGVVVVGEILEGVVVCAVAFFLGAIVGGRGMC